MTYEEMKAKYCGTNIRRKPKSEEHNIQASCVKWFRNQYPQLRNILFAVPNAARRSARNGAYMKEEGMLSGVADLILLKSNRFYGALCIEIRLVNPRLLLNLKRCSILVITSLCTTMILS